MRILVCGGRDYDNEKAVFDTLNELWNGKHSINEILTIIQGGAKGADALAKKYANHFEDECIEFKADWDKYGKSAGYIRNKQMLNEGKPDLVVAFPGGKGTANMVALTKKASVEVIEVG